MDMVAAIDANLLRNNKGDGAFVVGTGEADPGVGVEDGGVAVVGLVGGVGVGRPDFSREGVGCKLSDGLEFAGGDVVASWFSVAAETGRTPSGIIRNFFSDLSTHSRCRHLRRARSKSASDTSGSCDQSSVFPGSDEYAGKFFLFIANLRAPSATKICFLCFFSCAAMA